MNRFSSCTDVTCSISPLAPGLAAGHPATRELAAAATGTGEPIEGCPANPAVVADPGFAIGRDSGKERQLPVAAVGLRPIAFADHFKAAQIDRATDGVDAVGVAVGIHAGQQIGAAGAFGQARDLSPGIDRNQQPKAQQREFQSVSHGISQGADGLQHRALCRRGQEGSGLIVLLYYNIN